MPEDYGQSEFERTVKCFSCNESWAVTVEELDRLYNEIVIVECPRCGRKYTLDHEYAQDTGMFAVINPVIED